MVICDHASNKCGTCSHSIQHHHDKVLCSGNLNGTSTDVYCETVGAKVVCKDIGVLYICEGQKKCEITNPEDCNHCVPHEEKTSGSCGLVYCDRGGDKLKCFEIHNYVGESEKINMEAKMPDFVEDDVVEFDFKDERTRAKVIRVESAAILLRPLDSKDIGTNACIGDFRYSKSDLRHRKAVKIKFIDWKIIKAKKPCSEGYLWFLETFGHKQVTYDEIEKALNDNDWVNWLKRNMSEYLPKRAYSGRFSIGQSVYYEGGLDIGVAGRGHITAIEQAKDGNWFFSITPYRADIGLKPTHKFEKEVFSTFEELKEYWIQRVKNIKER